MFDFAASIGKKVFGKAEEPARASEQLRQHIEKNNPGVSGLEVAVSDKVATISGTASDAAAFEKAILIAGNVEGVGRVEASGLQGAGAADSLFVLVAEGDTLWGLAERGLGSGARYTEILAANREVIEDPDLISPGQKLRIPRS